ncbi:MAG TPA: cytochrome c [Gammaproteobacteria bacterium]|nr:cytochrome c [Gammaproteobacteria bacterium]
MKKIFTTTLISLTLMNVSFAGAGSMGHDSQHWDAPFYVKYWYNNPVSANMHSVNQGEQIFQKNCISCHGKSARGDGPLAKTLTPKPTNLRMMSGMHADGDFAWKISNGRGAMPAWKEMLKQEQIWHVVNYIQSLSKRMKMAKNEPSHTHDDQSHGH